MTTRSLPPQKMPRSWADWRDDLILGCSSEARTLHEIHNAAGFNRQQICLGWTLDVLGQLVTTGVVATAGEDASRTWWLTHKGVDFRNRIRAERTKSTLACVRGSACA